MAGIEGTSLAQSLNAVRRTEKRDASLDHESRTQKPNGRPSHEVLRYRHNVCVVRVARGQRKLSGNAIVFAQPVAKFSKVLPPPREDIDDCLVVLFTGSQAPTAADYKRTG